MSPGLLDSIYKYVMVFNRNRDTLYTASFSIRKSPGQNHTYCHALSNDSFSIIESL